jgi:hypothetical protein
MLKKSASIYLGGFVFGFLASAVLLVVYPALYYASLEFLRQKVVSQSKVIENLTFMSYCFLWGGRGVKNCQPH